MPLSNNTELARLKSLDEYRILDTDPEDQFDSITRLIKYICKTPGAFISFVDSERLWIKSEAGFPVKQIKREDSICNETIKADTILEIDDLSLDGRFTMLPPIDGPGRLRYYAGAPLKTPAGHKIGALCVIDTKPNHLNAEQKEALSVLANEVMSHLEIRKKNAQLEKMLDEAIRFRELFDNSNELHCIANSEGRIEYVNASVFSLLGYEPEELTGKAIWSFAPEEERHSIMPALRSAITIGQTKRLLESAIIVKDGSKKYFEWSYVFINGQWLINGRDITVRKQTERKLQDLSLAVKKSPAGVFIRDAKNAVQWMNEATEKIIGYSLAELEGRVFGDMMVGEKTDQKTLEYAKQCIHEKKAYEIEIVLYKKDNTPVWVFISNNPLFNENGELESQIGIIVDITTRKEAEEQLIKTRHEAIELSKSKEVFLSVMSHEMRTPLNAVIGMTRILKEDEPLDRQKENINILDFSAKNLLSLINDVLDFTKAETGNMQLESTPFDIYELADQTIESLRFKDPNKNIELKCLIDQNIPQWLTGDSTRLYQIFMNLAGNAVKFTEKGSVQLSLEMLDDDPGSVTVLIKVKDTGIGIPQSKQAEIFDAYVQAGSDTSRKYGGTGLGLAITKKLVELHGSHITVQSVPGVGSEFSFAIRFAKVLTTSKKKVAGTFTYGEPINAAVLIVDDNAMNRLLAGKVLSKWGIKTDFAEDGQQALDKVQNNDYDLVFMDIYMPVMNGLEAVRAIRALGPSRYLKLPVVALTANASKDEEYQYMAAGMNDFVIKPFEPETLYNKIRSLLHVDKH